MCVCVCARVRVRGWVGVRYALKHPPSLSSVHSCIVLSSDNSVTCDTSELSRGERETEIETERERERERKKERERE